MDPGFSVAYGEGWHPLEHDGNGEFRWTGNRARLAITSDVPRRSVWLRLACGAWGASHTRLLVVSVNGREVGRSPVNSSAGWLSFPLGPGSRFDVALAPDATFSVPGDSRALGVVVRDVDLIDEDALSSPLGLSGWHEREDYEYFPFNWMEREATSLVPGLEQPGARFLSIPVCAHTNDGQQVLTLRLDGRSVAAMPLLRGWHVYDVELRPDGDAGQGEGRASRLLGLELDALCPQGAHPGDGRSLGVRVGPIEVHADRRRHTYVAAFHDAWRRGATAEASTKPPRRGAGDGSVPCGVPAVGEGWHWEERGERGPFRWTRREALLRLPAGLVQGRRFCSLPVFSAYRNLSQQLTVAAGDTTLARFDLARGWHRYSLALPPPCAVDVELRVRLNKLTPASSHPGDPRELGVRVGGMALHDDEARHQREAFALENAVLNQREMQEGATEIRSSPQTLGIDLYGKCNIKPACVYCLWDPMKALEGAAVEEEVDERTLLGYGGIFEGARLLVNCSFGEPLLHPRLDRVLDLAASHGKLLELSTNGQAFTPRTVHMLAGRRVHLYVSLDAATAATYARLRNERWDEVVSALLFLRDARRAGAGWPRLYMVFMPMPSNLGDLEHYFRLCRLVEADQLVLRPLLRLDQPNMVRDRGGYHFDYERELMTPASLEPVFAECERYAARYEVQVISQFDFGLDEAPLFDRTARTREAM